MADSIKVQIFSLKGEVYNGQVMAISSYNETGSFDILPKHANFISIIKEKLILHLDNKEKKEIPMELGVLKHFQDQTKIYLGMKAELVDLKQE